MLLLLGWSKRNPELVDDVDHTATNELIRDKPFPSPKALDITANSKSVPIHPGWASQAHLKIHQMLVQQLLITLKDLVATAI